MTFIALLGAACASTTSGAKAQPGSTSSTVKPDYAFFKGKTIHWLTPGSPGSVQDQYVRAMLPSLEKSLGATINQTIVPGNQVIAADEIAQAAPDGLTIGTQGIGSALYNQLTKTSPESFNLEKVTYFGAAENTPYILVSCAGSGVTSLQQLVNANKKVSYLDFPNTGSVIMHTLLAAYNVNVSYLTGYTQPTLEAGCIRGDGTLAAGSATNIVANPSSLPPGETLLVISKPFAKGTEAFWMNTAKSSTTIAAFVKTHPITDDASSKALNIALGDTNNGPLTTVYGPPGIAKNKVAALVAAVKTAQATQAVKSVLLTAGIPPGYVAPSEMIPFIKKEVSHFPILRKYVSGAGL